MYGLTDTLSLLKELQFESVPQIKLNPYSVKLSENSESHQIKCEDDCIFKRNCMFWGFTGNWKEILRMQMAAESTPLFVPHWLFSAKWNNNALAVQQVNIV